MLMVMMGNQLSPEAPGMSQPEPSANEYMAALEAVAPRELGRLAASGHLLGVEAGRLAVELIATGDVTEGAKLGLKLIDTGYSIGVLAEAAKAYHVAGEEKAVEWALNGALSRATSALAAAKEEADPEHAPSRILHTLEYYGCVAGAQRLVGRTQEAQATVRRMATVAREASGSELPLAQVGIFGGGKAEVVAFLETALEVVDDPKAKANLEKGLEIRRAGSNVYGVTEKDRSGDIKVTDLFAASLDEFTEYYKSRIWFPSMALAEKGDFELVLERVNDYVGAPQYRLLMETQMAAMAVEANNADAALKLCSLVRRQAAPAVMGLSGSEEKSFAYVAQFALMHAALTESRAGASEQAMEDFRQAHSGHQDFQHRDPQKQHFSPLSVKLGCTLMEQELAAGHVDNAREIGEVFGWAKLDFEYVLKGRLTSENEPLMTMVRGLASSGRVSEALDLVTKLGSKEQPVKVGQFEVTVALAQGLLNHKGVLHRQQARELLQAEYTGEVGLNLTPLLLQAAGNPDRVSVVARSVRSSAQWVGVMKSIDGVKGLSVKEKAQLAATFLSATHDVWPFVAWRERLMEAAVPPSELMREGHRASVIAQLCQKARSSGKVQEYLDAGVNLAELVNRPWLLEDELSTADPLFPARAQGTAKARWVADHAFVFPAGFSRTAIGEIILQRLDGGQDVTLHNATYWLNMFAIPEKAVDVAALKAAKEQGKDVDLNDFMRPLRDYSLEYDLLLNLWQSDGKARLPTKPDKYEPLFARRETAMMYRAILAARKEGGENWQDRVADLMISYYGELKKADKISSVAVRIPGIDEYADTARALVEFCRQGEAYNHHMVTPPAKPGIRGWRRRRWPLPAVSQPLPGEQVVGRLRQIAEARKEYVAEATSWLQANRNAPRIRLQRAWPERNFAISQGVEDQAFAIENWAKQNATEAYVRQRVQPDGTIDLEGTITPGDRRGDDEEDNNSVPAITSTKKAPLTLEELRGEKYGPYLDELGKRYSAPETLGTIAWLKEHATEEADFPPAKIDLSGGYWAEIIPKDDPRGFTIGYDTACCMTISGVSRSCLEAGYSSPRYGFMILYGPDGLRAHSLIYNNPAVAADTIVLDNIEASPGRNMDRTLALYTEFLTKYLRPEGGRPLPYSEVNLGMGYTSVLLEGYKAADPVPPPLKTYTDGARQVKLLELEKPEVAAEVPAPVPGSVPVFTPVTQANAQQLAQLESQIYPVPLRTGAEELGEELAVAPEDNFSLIINAEDTGVPIGYVIATRQPDDPAAIYVTDLAVLPERQSDMWGPRAMMAVLGRAREADVQLVTMHTRATTSARAFRSPRIRARLLEAGWLVDEPEHLPGYYDDGEDAYLVHMRRADGVFMAAA
jgi:ribosomal protein S18 acetylase RimI-like enzyme